ncbi:hypothetical protein BC937DRAFT_93433 [Endogone sp. FLAS-F59071]|nr:hypothetical protein BC937DRAFT_93433 [Endogone sp. FLAS-F59071]|eukprot:RUS14716.1 hypothetical protein BC937DRAFT_93433 [Endogone sp. FLAS-F59071]
MSIDLNHIRALIRKAVADHSYYESTRTTLPSSESDSYTNQKRDRALDDVIATLQAQYDEQWRELEKLQSQLKASQKPQEVDTSSLQTQRLAILKTEERRLRSEIEQQKKEATTVEKKHPEVVRLLVKHQIFDSIAQYREALPSLKREMKEAEAALIREKEVLKECDAVAEVLRAKLQELRQSSGQSQSSASSQSRKELSDLKKRNMRIMRELISFIDEYYPPQELTPKNGTMFSMRKKAHGRRNKPDDAEPERQEENS